MKRAALIACLMSAALIACLMSVALFVLLVWLAPGDRAARIATHFDFSGNPDGWMTRGRFDGVMLATGLATVLLVGGGIVSAAWAPSSTLNLPDKEKWLSPEHLPATRRFFLRAGLGYAALLALFFAGLHALVLEANRHVAPRLSGAGLGILVGGLLTGTLALLVTIAFRFRRRNGPNR